MSETLRGCPHCGPRTTIDVNSIQLVCLSCGLHGPVTAGQGEDCTAAIAAWNALPRHLQWTTETPTEPGWYWNRVAGKESLPMRLYYDSDGEYCYQVAGLPNDCWLVEDLADEVGCEWAGPIDEPEEEK